MTERLLTADEVAEMLQLKRVSIYQLVWKKRIPYIAISKKAIRFSPTAIRNWLESRHQPVQAQPQTQERANRCRGRTRKTSDDYVNRIVEQSKKEVL